jgi:DNA/RNA endonuclease YhcR with UshA esterase domain
MNIVRWSKVLGTAALLILATQTILAAQKVANTGPKYDVANEVKIKGVVEDIREVPGNFEGTHLVVKTDTGTVLVHVAPADFLKEMDTSFKKGDVVEVIGAKAPDATEPEILAREITVGTNTTTLRDDKGIPVWAGWKPAKSN